MVIVMVMMMVMVVVMVMVMVVMMVMVVVMVKVMMAMMMVMATDWTSKRAQGGSHGIHTCWHVQGFGEGSARVSSK